MDDYEQESSPHILFLAGIQKDDYKSIEDKATEKILESVDGRNSDHLYEYSIYNKNNIKFLSSNKWPSLTDLHCWYCDFTFGGNSIFIPTYIKECANGSLEFGVRGYMCTFNCAMSIILSTTARGSAERWKYINNLKILYFIKNGYHISDIKPAPCKYNLKKYGGDWTNEKFWEELRNLDIYGKDNESKQNVPEKERISLVFDNFTSSNNRSLRIFDDIDDCAIYNGNRITLCKNTIWSLNSKIEETTKIDNNYLLGEETTKIDNNYLLGEENNYLLGEENNYLLGEENIQLDEEKIQLGKDNQLDKNFNDFISEIFGENI